MALKGRTSRVERPLMASPFPHVTRPGLLPPPPFQEATQEPVAGRLKRRLQRQPPAL